MHTWWLGPAVILAKMGENSYDVSLHDGGRKNVHASHLKPYINDVVMEGGVPLHYYKPDDREPAVTPAVEAIRDHRHTPTGELEFLIHWENSPPGMDSWVALGELIARADGHWKPYCQSQGIESIPVGTLAVTAGVIPTH